ncbi:LytTR family DNA-binding domain-containing protein [Mucilaginibacter sp. PAMB04168]|uniref:LytR/AlgR family response regulator transcription factor n=1 Tax=Mucilaginibacter sp. PAMB04168 TaxID=3138567 RepID=UPI0031F675EE
MIKAVIVEDSRLARIEIKELLRAHNDVLLVGEADSADKALELIRLVKPDLVFLDIHLPGASGFEILERLEHLPAVIFTTAFEHYAFQSYDYHAIDYLLKPIVPERLARAIRKACTHFGVNTTSPAGDDLQHRIFIKDQHKTWLVPLGNVRLFESKGNYVQVFFDDQNPLMLRSLQQLEDTLDPKQFMRINRQQIINLKHILKVGRTFGNRLKVTLSDGATAEVSRRQVAKFRERVELDKN